MKTARDFIIKTGLEKEAYKIGVDQVKNDPALDEAGIGLDEFDTIDLIVLGLECITGEIENLMYVYAEEKR